MKATKFMAEHSDTKLLGLKSTLIQFVEFCKNVYALTKGSKVPPVIAARLAIRMTIPTPDFDFPRWPYL